MPRVPRPLAYVLVGSMVLGVLAVPGVGYAAYRHDVDQRAVLPVGSQVGGVDVGGMDRTSAVAAVQAVVQRYVDRPSVVTVGGQTLAFTPRELGVTDDAESAVDSAFTQALTGSWTDRAWDRFRGETSSPSAEVTVTPADLAPLEARAAETAAALALPAQDATVKLVGGKPTWTPSAPGRQVDPAAVVDALEAGLSDGTPREVPLQEVAPAVGEDAFGTVLVVRTGTNVLEVYKGQQLVRTFGVATGAPEFPTPTGRTSVTLKRYRPTWVNPGSDWGKSMPARIGPGPGNPLGTRALNLGFPNIRIHGTPAASSIGYSVSHGCIRMRMPDVEALYDMVPAGATVFVVRGGAPRLPTAAAASVDTVTAAAADGG